MKLHLGDNPEKPTITAEVPSEELVRLEASFPFFAESYTSLLRAKEITLTASSEGTTSIGLMLARIGRRSEAVRQGHLLSAVAVLDVLSYLPDGDDDRLRDLTIEQSGVGADGRRRIDATIMWPEMHEADTSGFATRTMRLIARQLDYDRDQFNRSRYEGHIGAVLQRYPSADSDVVSGASFIANAQGSCATETDGNTYDPSKPSFELTSHNIYSREQQLICLAGMIAVATADQILHTQ
jgi:hypothetical protein